MSISDDLKAIYLAKLPTVPEQPITSDDVRDCLDATADAIGDSPGGPVTWSSITGKPTAFAPAPHVHAVADVTGLQAALDAKAALAHTHALSQLTQSGATTGQVVKWNGSAWVPADDTGGGASTPVRDIDISAYGIIGDRKERMGSMSAGSTTLTCSLGGFSSADIGKKIYVDDAVSAGVRGSAGVFSIPGGNLIATITAVLSSTQVTLSQAAGVTVNLTRIIWGTDNTDAMNALIASTQSPYNQVSFYGPRGGYLFFDKISIPASTVAGARSISFSGQTFPTQWFGTVTEDPLNQDGTIFQGLSQTPGSALFKFEAGTGAYFGVSLIHPVFEKLNLRTYDQPVIDCVDAYAASHLIMDHVDVTTGVFSVIAKEPSPALYDANGVRTPKVDNGAITILRNVSASGYFVGIEVNEHTYGEYINLTCNWYAMNFRQATHASSFSKINAQRNHRTLNFAGTHRVIITLLNIEYANPGSQVTPDNAWQVTDYVIYDPQNHARGKVLAYNCVLGGHGPVRDFPKAGGAYLKATYIDDGFDDIAPLPVAPAPTAGVVDDTANTFNWTFASGFANNSDYEYTLNGGASYSTVSSKPIQVGDVDKAIGQVGVRVKAVPSTSQASITLFNTTAFISSGVPPADSLVYDSLLNVTEIAAGVWQEGGSSGTNTATQNWGVAAGSAIAPQVDFIMESVLASSNNNGILLGIDNNTTGVGALVFDNTTPWKIVISASENVVVFWEQYNTQQVNTSVSLPFSSNSRYGIRVSWSGSVATAQAVYSVDAGATWQVAHTYLTPLSASDTHYAKMSASIVGRSNLNPKLTF